MKRARCPVCGKPMEVEHRPFCSARCADIDLQRWLSDRYVVRDDEDAEGVNPADEES